MVMKRNRSSDFNSAISIYNYSDDSCSSFTKILFGSTFNSESLDSSDDGIMKRTRLDSETDSESVIDNVDVASGQFDDDFIDEFRTKSCDSTNYTADVINETIDSGLPNISLNTAADSDVYHRLVLLCQNELSDIITTLLGTEFDLESVLNEIRTNSSCLFIFMKILGIICKSNSALKIEILQTVCKSSLLDCIQLFLQRFIEDTSPIKTPAIWSFLDHLVDLYFSIFNLLPEMVLELNLKEYISKTLMACNLMEEYFEDRFPLRFRLNDLVAKLETFPAKTRDSAVIVTDFRTLSLYPTFQHLLTKSLVQPNLIKGMYADVEEYLNVQFYLLRECFFEPIKIAIHDYWNDHSGIKFRANSRFRRLVCRHGMLCCEIEMKLNHTSKTCSDSAHGSLLAFSNDNFRTFFFGVLIESSGTDNLCLVTLIDDEVSLDKIFNSVYITVSTIIQFDQFNYPALMLILASKSNENLPFTSYFINPALNSSNFQCKEIESRKQHRRQLANDLFSPSNSATFSAHLDQYQLTTLKAALSENLTLISGLRGTGKTYLAGKIVQTLLQVNNFRRSIRRLPILMICRSNAALDQFLRFALKHTPKIVRIGGKSSCLSTKYHNLRALHQNAVEGTAQKTDLLKLEQQVKNLSDKIKDIDDHAGILSCDLLKTVMSEKHKRTLNEERLLTMLLDEDGFVFDWEKSTEAIAGQIKNIVLSELEWAKKIRAFAESEAQSKVSVENKVFTANEVFIDDDFNSNIPLLNDINISISDRLPLALSVKKAVDLYLRKVDEFEAKFYQIDEKSNFKLKELFFVAENVQMLRRNIHILKTQLENLDQLPEKTDLFYSSSQQKDFSSLNFQDRWSLYGLWVSQIKRNFLNSLIEYVNKYREGIQKFHRMLDLQVLSEADVVGVTTACMAKFWSYFETLQPSIVIVEEATEIMEAEIVAFLPKTCEQLILFADPHAMKPSTLHSKFSQTYRLDVSLFERLVNNGFICHSLKIQRDTPPEINSLLHSSFENDLLADSVPDSFPKIDGVAKNVFFLNHKCTQKSDELSVGVFISKISTYLTKRKFSPSEITIIVLEPERIDTIKQVLSDSSENRLKSISVTPIHDIRSKTNKIILFSFVNGWTTIMNADVKKRLFYTVLTRASLALYVVGDIESLAENFDFWHSMQETLQKCNSIGDSIVLNCEKHRKFLSVSVGDDIWNGCGETCNTIFPCTHYCSFPCHFDDSAHTANFKCQAKVQSVCTFGHICEIRCGVGYAQCTVEVFTRSQYCGHTVRKKCGEPMLNARCSQICDEILCCGHKCSELCHRQSDPTHKKIRCAANCGKIHPDCLHGHVCTKFCSKRCGFCSKIETCTLKCGHEAEVLCSFDLSRVKCYQKCKKTCDKCGVKCEKYCFEDCQPCTNMVLKYFNDCDHEKLIECGKILEDEVCDVWINITSVITSCGHRQLHIPCSKKNEDLFKLSSYCTEPCGAVMSCGHICTGTCGSCFQGRIHSGCNMRCETVLACGHECQFLCENLPQLCEKTCIYECQHLKCNSECGLPCVPCKVNCEWKCKHSECSRTCCELCDRSPCYEQCDRIVYCGHPCIGFCGEPCPPVCRYCDRDFLISLSFCDIDNLNTRFVLLVDCQHIVESRKLEEHLSSSDTFIALKRCPYAFCRKPILNTLRYKNLVKQYFQTLKNLKRSLILDESIHELNHQINEKLCKVWIFFRRTDMNMLVCDIDSSFRNLIREASCYRSSLMLLKSFIYFLDLMLDMGSRYSEFKNVKFSSSFPELLVLAEEVRRCVENVLNSLLKQASKISIQLVEDLYCEANRFHQILDFCQIVKFGANAVVRQSFSVFQTILCTPGKYTEECRQEVDRLNLELQKSLGSSSVSPRSVQYLERTEVLKTMILNEKLGRWCLCSNKHYYLVTERRYQLAQPKCPYCQHSVSN